MTKQRTNKKTDHENRDTSSKVAGKSWFMIGLLVVVTGLGLYWLEEFNGFSQIAQEVTVFTPKKETAAVRTKPDFEFYTILPETKVVVPAPMNINQDTVKKVERKPPVVVESKPIIKPSTATIVQTPPKQANNTPSSHNQYLIQVASLTHRIDADRLKAELVLLGYDVHIKQHTINGATWYRVHVGPYLHIKSAERDKQTLKAKDYDGIIRKIS